MNHGDRLIELGIHFVLLSLIAVGGANSIGGLRASLYNAVTEQAVDILTNALTEFSLHRA